MKNNRKNNIESVDELDDVVQLRTANSKHYRNGNGSYSAVIFDSPVHYLDEADNTYKEIDMSLEEDNARLFDGYKIKSNKFALKFAKALSMQSLMVLEDKTGKIDVSCGGYAGRSTRLAANIGAVAKTDYPDKKLSPWKRLLSRGSAVATSVVNAAKSIPIVEKVKSLIQQRLDKCKKLASNIMYENAFVGADLEYVLSPNKIKENIIVGSRTELYEYTFTLRLDGFDMQLAKVGGGINIVSKTDGTTKYTIPAPFMYDANGTRSDAVMLRADKISDGVFELGIVADKAWINAPERTFPVVIDPQIISTETTGITMNSYKNGVLIPSGDNLNALGRCYGDLYDMKVAISTPSIVSWAFGNDTRVLNATIELTKAEDCRRAGSLGFNVLKDGRVIDHFTYNGSNNRVDINITNELNAAIKGNDITSVFDIQAIDRTSTDNDYMLLINSTDDNSEFRPKIMIDYVPDRLSLGASYHTSDVKRAGVGQVNLFNGNLTFTHTDLTADGSNMPIDIKHIYMSKLKGKEYDCETYGEVEHRLTPDYKTGKGWKLNIQQYLLNDDADGIRVKYLDGNGEMQIFEEKYFYEVNGTKKFVKREQCIPDDTGSLFVTIGEGENAQKYPATHAYMTESGLTLVKNYNKTLLLANGEDDTVKTVYYVIYNDEKCEVKVDGNRCTFIRYYSNGPYGARWYYKNSDVECHTNGKYYKKGTEDEVYEEKIDYDIENVGGKKIIGVIEYSLTSHGSSEMLISRKVSLAINAEYIYPDRIVDGSNVLFDNENLISLYNDIQEVKSYLADMNGSKVKYEQQAHSIMYPSEINEKMENALDEYIKKRAEIDAAKTDYEEALFSIKDSVIEFSSYLREASFDSKLYEVQNLFNEYLEEHPSSLSEKLKIDFTKDPNWTQYHLAGHNIDYETKSLEYQRAMQQMNNSLNLLEDEYNMYKNIKEEQDEQAQLKIIESEVLKLRERISEYEKVLEKMQRRFDVLIEEEKNKPIDYVIDASMNKMGFDFYGKLVEVSDNNQNKIAINYDGDKIVSVTTNDGGVIRFEYYYDRLNKITDLRARTTLFEYNDGGFLSKIVYPDNQSVSLDGQYDNRITEFAYNPYNELEEVKDQSGYAVKYAYNYFKQVETVREYTYAQEISPDRFEQTAPPIEGDSVAIQYNNFKSTSVKNNKGVATTYVFDNAGRAVNIYRDDQFVSEDMLNVTDAVSLGYVGRRKAYDITVSQFAENYAHDPGFENGTSSWVDATDPATSHCTVIGTSYVGGSHSLRIDGHPQRAQYAKQVIPASELPTSRNLIFSAWAKARSAFIRSDRSSCYGDDLFEGYTTDSMDDFRRNRKFGIRAVIEYADGELDTMETTFDWYNTAWQFTALPIRLNKEKTLVSITLYLDYTNNINFALFDNVQLIKAEGNYQEFYDDGKVRYSTDGKVDTFYPKYYNGMPTHKIEVDEDGRKYLTEYVYDANNRLVRMTDHDGIVTEYTYRANGEILKTETYHKTDPGTKFVTESQYDSVGRKISDIDPRGVVNGETLSTKYTYISGTNLQYESKDCAGNAAVHAYDVNNDNKLSVTESDDGEDNKNVFEYTKGYLTRMHNDAASFEYGYDGFGKVKFVKLDGKAFAEYEYAETSDGGETVTTAFENGEAFVASKDKHGNTKQLQYKSDVDAPVQNLITSKYDEFTNRLDEYTDGLTGETHKLYYDGKGRAVSDMFVRNGSKVESTLTYDSKDNVKQSTLKLGTETLTYGYEYSQSVTPKLLSTEMPNGTVSAYGYDKLGRITAKTLTDEAGNAVMQQNVYYVKYGDHATTMPSSERFGLHGSLDEQAKYKYDKNGNITEVYKNGLLTNRYSYDKLNRMVREDNKPMGQTMVFNYDTNGNVLTKSVYAFTLGEILEKQPIAVIPYSYRANVWRDQMTAYNGQKCEYDAIGCPTKYRNNVTTFKYGGLMTAYGNNTYKYDANGERVSKTVNGVETRFITVNGKVVRSETNGVITDFYYDSYGLTGIKHNGVSYFVRKNILGDVTHIYDTTGNLVARYVYDAWGNHKVVNALGTEDADILSIGNINPIRYRGYFYDTETKLYYLKARYYDSEVGRFISADDTSFLDPNTVNGLNLYAYCASNPVMNVDPSGRSLIATIFAVIGGIIFGSVAGGIVGGLSEMSSGGSFMNGFWGGLANGFISTIGLALGAVTGPFGYLVASAFGVIGGIAGGIITEGVKTGWNISDSFWKKDFWTNVIPMSLFNGLTNALYFKLGKIMDVGVGAHSTLSMFKDWLSFGGYSYSSVLAVGFPMFALSLIPIMLMSSKKVRSYGQK